MLADNEHIRLQQNVQTRSLTNRQGESAFQYVRIFKIMEIVHELLQSDKQATQRDLYYRLLYPPIFCTTKVPEEVAQHCSAASGSVLPWSMHALSRRSVTCTYQCNLLCSVATGCE